MLEIRFHGRGGQGAVTTAELVARAAISEGKYGQAFPSFGPERRGAPVLSFCRVHESPILLRSQIREPDAAVVLDPSLLEILDPSHGLKKDGVLILNSHQSVEDLRKKYKFKCRLALVDASAIAKEILKLPITNTAMLGALLKATAVVKVESLKEPIAHRFGKVADRNFAACERAFKETQIKE